MKIHQTKYEDITIAEDVYPFVEARKLVEQLESWWEHPSRSKPLVIVTRDIRAEFRIISVAAVRVTLYKKKHTASVRKSLVFFSNT